MTTESRSLSRPLDGIRVLEAGQLLAGPFAGTILGYFGADVIKVEPPKGGDPIRGWRLRDEDGTSVWWRSLARNKRCITLDLRKERGAALCRRLAEQADVLIENFRPGRMESWGLGPEDLRGANPGLVYVRVSGFGQTGPYRDRPGFAAVCEAVGGLRHVTGYPGETPIRPNLSLGDTLAGIHAALGAMMALRARDRPDGRGQVVDVALYESVFNVLESIVPEYSRFGAVRAPSGTTLTGVAPSNAYRCRDGRHVVIGANGDSIFRRLMDALGRPELARDPRFSDNAGRVAHGDELDAAISAWTSVRGADAVMDALAAASVPAGLIYDATDMAEDPHFRARGLFERVSVGERDYEIPAILPRLAETPGATEHVGPDLGAHNDAIYGDFLGLTEAERAELRKEGVI